MFVVVSIIVDFLLIVLLMWLNRRIFIDIFYFVSDKSKAILFLIVILFSILAVLKGYNFKTFIPSDEEWVLMRQAKDLLYGGQILNQLRYGFVYPILLVFGFLIFGFNPLVASVMTFVLGVLSILLIFAISQQFFKNEIISLISTAMYSFSPSFYIFTTLQMGYPGLVNFFLLFFVLVSVLSFQKHKTSLYVLSIVLLAITAQIKPEYFILIVPYGLFFILLKEYKNFRTFQLFIMVIIYLAISSPYLFQNMNFRSSYASGWCGEFSLVGITPEYSNLLTKIVDPVVKSIINERFSINYFINKIPSFFKYWSFRSLSFISPIIVIGLVVALKKHTKMTLYLISIFFSITILYLADCFLYESRYAFPTFGLVVMFFGVGINFLINLVGRGGNVNQLFKKVLLISFSILMMIYLYFYEYKNSLFKGYYYDYYWVERNVSNLSDSFINLDKLIIGLPKNNTMLLVPHSNEANYLNIKGYKSLSLTNIESFNTNDNADYKNISLPINQEKYNYYLELNTCNYPVLMKQCNYVRENYALKQLKEAGGNNRLYKISIKPPF